MNSDLFKFKISLGATCFPRVFLVRHGYMENKPYPVRMPFDGSVHSYEAVCEFLRTDFSFVRSKESVYRNKAKSGNMVFRHSDFYLLLGESV